ncbi:phospholipid carrier-dependent glycosyltransferase [Corynebacterium sp. 4HC-13]|uniref:Polyprenol-phosphate-mannose--protein mannosyltransferase n=2 Tax=Corynebacterium anserum TaxID=2684406 RepID=A0A7G7YR81_9CORY|nr:phospholipid carrier-dependent glycosyltransferase [Corynebacterium anserum]MBC2682027.1 phospholipid carrier-dependent glycosyltransferase [Corynebacterium anserum]QNH97001.1 phospholipid carrier-dependent glycosyltransferase [Corynebacterium anserum]
MSVLTRLPLLNSPTDKGTPIFDEKHYVPQTWQMLRGWDNIFVGGIEDNPGFGLVVHPPLAKQLQAFGQWLFGYTPLGWRIVTACMSVAVIVLIAAIARRISRSDAVGLLSGICALSEGILFVTGRSGMLDHTQTLFVVAATYFAVRDWEQMEQRFRVVWARGGILDHPFGPRMGFRWWRFACGVALGGSLAVKWSGLYYLAFFGVVIVLLDWHRRHRYRVSKPFQGAAIMDCWPAFASLVLIPVALYFLSFRAWFANDSSVYRHAIESGHAEGFTGGPLVQKLPQSLQNFFYYQWSVLKFHTELTNSRGHYHPWESKPWSWLISSRSLMYYNPGTSDNGTRHIVLLVGTPAIWWLCVPVLLWGVWSLIIRRELAWVIPLAGFAAGFIPWLFELDRQMYLFYAVNLSPFLVIALALAMGQLLRWRLAKPGETTHRYGAVRLLRLHTGAVIVVAYVMLVVWNFLFFWPIYTGVEITQFEWAARIWLPSWV